MEDKLFMNIKPHRLSVIINPDTGNVCYLNLNDPKEYNIILRWQKGLTNKVVHIPPRPNSLRSR